MRFKEEITFLKAQVRDLESHIQVIMRRIKKLEKEEPEKKSKKGWGKPYGY